MAREKRENLVLHQTLHGYADGHRLLAASRKLPREGERVLLVLSDLSGQGVVEGFESYLTGYPIPGAGAYALARSWYAPEMGRPGCVWTHTLLIDEGDLGRLEEPGTLTHLFRRPPGPGKFMDYEVPLQVTTEGLFGENGTERFVAASLAQLIDALYGSPDRPVVVAIDRPTEIEEMFLIVWSQQWPALRRSFTFCTGSLSNRALHGTPFDLQGVPLREVRRFAKVEPSPQVINIHDDPGIQHHVVAEWVVRACSDLIAPTDSKLRPFLRWLSQDLAGDRRLFRPLIQIYSIAGEHNGKPPAAELIRAVADSFPETEDAASLKVALFGPEHISANNPYLQTTEPELLRDLVLTPLGAAFEPEALRIRERAQKLWESSPHEAESLLVQLVEESINPLGEAFLRGIADAASGASLGMLCSSRPEALRALIERKPGLATEAVVWRCPLGEQLKLVDLLARNDESVKILLPKIVGAALTAGTDEIARDFVHRLGYGTVPLVLDWFNTVEQPELSLRPGWIDVLRHHAELCLRWFESAAHVRAQTVRLLTTVLHPGNTEVRARSTELWLRHAPAEGQLANDTYVRVMAFYLAMALDKNSAESFPAAALAFDAVYRAASRGALDVGSWDLLAGYLPPVSWWREWDRCARLQLGIVERFLGDAWPACRLLEITSDTHVLEKLADTFKESRDGRRFLRAIAGDIETGKIHASPAQLELIK